MSARPPAELGRLVRLFRDAPADLRLLALHEHADRLPALPAGTDVEDMERVVECQSAFYFDAGLGDDGAVEVRFSCPAEAPTTRGFAALLSEGLTGSSPEEVLAIPDNLHTHLGLDEVISDQRLGGMEAVVIRLKRRFAPAG